MTLAEFLQWLATAAAPAVVSSLIVDFIKAVWPDVEEKKAAAVSIVVAMLASALALVAQPYIGDIPPELEQVWPLIVWAIQQLWYQFIGKNKVESWLRENVTG